jgi:hypothetical protein
MKLLINFKILPETLYRCSEAAILTLKMLTGTCLWSLTVLPEGVCTDEFLSRKPGFLLSAIHNHAFRWFSAAPLVFLFLGLLPLQLNQIWRIFCVFVLCMKKKLGALYLIVCKN